MNERKPVPKESWVAVGKIVGVWGIEGALKVRSLTSVTGRLSVDSIVYIDGNLHKIESERPSTSGLILRLQGLRDRTEAETVVGSYLEVPLNTERPQQRKGKYYHFEIIGIRVFNESEIYLGDVVEIIETGANDVYVVNCPDSEDILVPATRDAVRNVDPVTRTMVVRHPHGI